MAEAVGRTHLDGGGGRIFQFVLILVIAGARTAFGGVVFDADVVSDVYKRQVLSERLEDLEKSGLVNRIDYQEKSPRVEYTLTQTGKFAYQIIWEISIWGYKYELANSRFVITQ